MEDLDLDASSTAQDPRSRAELEGVQNQTVVLYGGEIGLPKRSSSSQTL
jgi:heptaprenylglyceryl phosphate synthase